MIKVQVTIFDENGKYRPMSIVFSVESREYLENHKQEILQRGLREIAIKRRLTPNELRKMGFTKGKAREYDKEKIIKEKIVENYLNKRAREKKQKATEK